MTDYPRDPDRTHLTDDPSLAPTSGRAPEPVAPAVSEETLDRLITATVFDSEGEKVGSVGRVYLRDETGKPSWVTVKSGFFGMRESLVPMSGVDTDTDDLRVPYTKDVIKGAPHVEADDHLSPAEEEELQSYYRGHGWAGHGDAHREGVVGDERDDRAVDDVRDDRVVDDVRDDRALGDVRDDRVVDDVRDDRAADDPVSALDDPGAQQRRDERFERMDERVEKLEDQSVTDSLLAGSAGVGGLGVAGADHGTGERAVAGTDHDAGRSEAVPGDRAGDEPDVVPGDRSVGEPDVVPGDRDSRDGHADVAGSDAEIGLTSTGDRYNVPWVESSLDEVRDGGYGIGSAAPLGDRTRPLGHPVRAWEDTKSFRSGEAVHVERTPDVWFLDEQAAYNAGFHHAD